MKNKNYKASYKLITVRAIGGGKVKIQIQSVSAKWQNNNSTDAYFSSVWVLLTMLLVPVMNDPPHKFHISEIPQEIKGRSEKHSQISKTLWNLTILRCGSGEIVYFAEIRRQHSCLFFLLILLILMHVIPLCRCICLLKRWQKELLKWECQVPWHTASHLKLFWSVLLCVCVCVCVCFCFTAATSGNVYSFTFYVCQHSNPPSLI